MLSILSLIATASAGSNVLVCYSSGYESDVYTKLHDTKMFTNVAETNCGSTTPTVADLLVHDAVLVYSDSGFSNPSGLGNNLADYVDSAGGVVEAVFANGSVPLSGRFESGGYEPITGSLQSSGTVLTSVILDPGHDVMNGVVGLNGGTSSYITSNALFSATAAPLANWNTGLPLVGADDSHAGRTVGLNFYPPSSTIRSDFWKTATDGEWILANALDWAIGAPSAFTAPATLNVSGVCPGAVTIEIIGGTPDGTASIYTGATSGSGTVKYGVCGGSATDLDAGTLRLRKSIQLDASGYAILVPTLGAAPCGMSIQVVDRESCTAGNLAVIP